jgi:hypothetical protein
MELVFWHSFSRSPQGRSRVSFNKNAFEGNHGMLDLVRAEKKTLDVSEAT